MLSILIYKDHTYLTLVAELKCEKLFNICRRHLKNHSYHNNQTHGYTKGQTQSLYKKTICWMRRVI